jgi:hypothetical protein
VALAEPAAQVAREAQAELVVRVAQEAQAELVVRVAQEAQAELVVRVAQEELVELVVLGALAGPAIDLAVALELEIAQVAVLETKHLAAHLAVVLRTKSVIAAHRRGLVPVPKRVEDLAAAAETTREPAAAEAAKAWAAEE